MFGIYRFDNLEADESHVLNGWSYLWATLSGPVYVLLKGFVAAALVMPAVSAAIAVAAAGALVIAVGVFDSQIVSVLAAFAITVAALAAQGATAIELVRMGYIRSSWREGYCAPGEARRRRAHGGDANDTTMPKMK